ncbi:MAG: hypothetical protein RR248_04090 [Clostridia bacterium]
MSKIAKTILTCYTTIPTIVKKIDKQVYNSAVTSHNLTYGYARCDAYGQMKAIAELIEKKSELLELFNVAKDALSKLDKLSRRLLVSKYITQLSLEQMLKDSKLPQTTLYRYLSQAISKFASSLIVDGYDENWFLSTYLKQNWIKKVYNKQQ